MPMMMKETGAINGLISGHPADALAALGALVALGVGVKLRDIHRAAGAPALDAVEDAECDLINDQPWHEAVSAADTAVKMYGSQARVAWHKGPWSVKRKGRKVHVTTPALDTKTGTLVE